MWTTTKTGAKKSREEEEECKAALQRFLNVRLGCEEESLKL
jgi:hypothetical protein